MLASDVAAWKLEKGLFRDERMSAAGIRHGFTTKNVGDMRHAPQRERALRCADISSADCHLLQQVHGTEIHVVSDVKDVPADGTKGDGWLVHAAGVTVGVYTADCVPLFLWHVSGKAVGVFHAGWRGVQAGMPKKAVEAFAMLGYKPSELQASIAPHIKACCFQVGPEVASQFRPSSVIEKEGKQYVDLGTEALAQLQEAGMDPHAAAAAPACTACQKEVFFSYRRDKVVGGGRMMAFATAGGR